ncbi:MAG: Divergent polysaccharide deacetylase [Syntrophaceae bacterium PtaU1.Bin231]|nr:MAG: Divergent polysaccharide deacetylase [Syntrophaceae bacterium PtaU1.Bin231]
MGKKRRHRRKFFSGLILCFVLAALVSAAYLLLKESPPSGQGKSKRKQHWDASRMPRNTLTGKEAPQRLYRKQEARVSRKRLAIIMDDIGQDLKAVEELLRTGAPITFSILPHCTYSRISAEKIHRAGREILLHLPMEPHGFPEVDPGKGALLVGMDPARIRRELSADLEAVPYVSGVNNHMGSKFMEDGPKLRVVFDQLKKKGLFFVDSGTTANSRAREVAEAAGLRLISRDAFLDHGNDPDQTCRELMRLASGNGDWERKVVIAHPYPGTVEALKKFVRKVNPEKIEIVPVSSIQD